MAPIPKNAKSIKGKHFKSNFAHGGPSYNAKGKRKWVQDNKFFDGSLKEGQGFALKRKEKIKHQYNKILRKERWKTQQSKVKLHEEYPEHLKHLYLAEKERLDEEEQANKSKRWNGRAVDSDAEEEQTITMASTSGKNDSNTTPDISAGQKQSESSHKAQFMQRKQKNVSSYQKTKQEYERLKQEREQKREEFLKNKAQREEAVKKYKEKKMATYQLLKRKTKKGQPNLNIQMELLLQKIQAQQK